MVTMISEWEHRLLIMAAQFIHILRILRFLDERIYWCYFGSTFVTFPIFLIFLFRWKWSDEFSDSYLIWVTFHFILCLIPIPSDINNNTLNTVVSNAVVNNQSVKILNALYSTQVVAALYYYTDILEFGSHIFMTV